MSKNYIDYTKESYDDFLANSYLDDFIDEEVENSYDEDFIKFVFTKEVNIEIFKNDFVLKDRAYSTYCDFMKSDNIIYPSKEMLTEKEYNFLVDVLKQC